MEPASVLHFYFEPRLEGKDEKKGGEELKGEEWAVHKEKEWFGGEKKQMDDVKEPEGVKNEKRKPKERE